jgi:hypothetical protein
MKNIFLLPTDKPSRLYLEDVKFKLTEYDYPNVDYAQNQHIYITNDEEIKEEDWVFGMDGIFQYKGKVNLPDVELPKKIILTTDLELIADGIQAIGNEFLEWFLNNPNREEVEVKIKTKWKTTVYDQPDMEDVGYTYKIIIPQEEPKQEIELIDGFIPTSFFDKQETLEEASLKYIETSAYMNITPKDYIEFGAKYRSESRYSEEEFLAFGKSCFYKGFEKSEKDDVNCFTAFREEIECLFEQFKKK